MMDNVIRRIKRCFTIYTALFITLITSRVRAYSTPSQPAYCSHEQLVACAKPLSLITESGLTFVSSRQDLERICPDLKRALRCIHAYTRTCMSLHHRKHFKQLFEGTGEMVHDLCDSPAFQDEYLQYTPCMRKVADENEACFARYSRAMNQVNTQPQEAPRDYQVKEAAADTRGTSLKIEEITLELQKKRKRQIADEGIRNVCCTFQEYVECSTRVTQRQCGEEAAAFGRRFLDRMSSSMIQMHCAEYSPSQCGLASSGATHKTTFSSVSLLLLGSLLSLKLIN